MFIIGASVQPRRDRTAGHDALIFNLSPRSNLFMFLAISHPTRADWSRLADSLVMGAVCRVRSVGFQVGAPPGALVG
jgi:hypothetical protein